MEGVQLYRKIPAASGRGPAPSARLLALSAPRLALGFLYDLSAVLTKRPQVFSAPGGRAVTALFKNACYASGDFLLDFQEVMAAVSRSWPVTVYGTVEGAGTGEMRAELTEEGIRYVKSSVSGRDFNAVSDLCVSIDTGSPEEGSFLTEVLEKLDYRERCISVRRRHQALCRAAELCGAMDGAHFLYLPLTEDAQTEDRLECLTITDKAELWTEYLTEGVSALEFEWAVEEYRSGGFRGLLEWELSLRGVLPGLGVSVENGPGQFRVTRADGRPLRLGFENAPAAGKLFLKILFPVKPEVR